MSLHSPFPPSSLLPPVTDNSSLQALFDSFYATLSQLLYHYFPLKTVTTSDRDPPFVTPAIKSALRKRNLLAKQGKPEEAEALSELVRKSIIQQNSRSLTHLTANPSSSNLWAAYRDLCGKPAHLTSPSALTANDFNLHYSSVSLDIHPFLPPPPPLVLPPPPPSTPPSQSIQSSVS
jgi:hypothetical protein